MGALLVYCLETSFGYLDLHKLYIFKHKDLTGSNSPSHFMKQLRDPVLRFCYSRLEMILNQWVYEGFCKEVTSLGWRDD